MSPHPPPQVSTWLNVCAVQPAVWHTIRQSEDDDMKSVQNGASLSQSKQKQQPPLCAALGSLGGFGPFGSGCVRRAAATPAPATNAAARTQRTMARRDRNAVTRNSRLGNMAPPYAGSSDRPWIRQPPN
jgi:hypothetical protein